MSRAQRRASRTARTLVVLVAVGVAGVGDLHEPFVSEAAAEDRVERAWLGVQMAKAAAGGIIAERVIRNSPAYKGGVRADDMLVSIDGIAIESTKQVIGHVTKAGVGQKTTVRVRRGGVEKDFAVTLEAFPGVDEVLRMDKVGTFAPTWQDTTGVKGTLPDALSKLRGRVVLLDFWASWCAPCRIISPKLSDLSDRLGAQGLTVIGITSDSVERATKAADALDMHYVVGSDVKDKTAAAYGVQALPTMFVIDKKGVIREVLVGFNPADDKRLEALLNKLLAEPAPAP